MLKKLLLCTVPALAATAAFAQAGPVQKVTSDQLVCQLSGDCQGNDIKAVQEEKPESRGFSFVKKSGAQAPAAAAPAANRMAAAQSRPAANAGSRYVAARAPAAKPSVGRADLRIGFVSGSAILTPDDKELAGTFLQALRSPQLTGKRFMIAGHTDAVGSRAYNLDLSQRRAQALVDYLVTQGASRDQFELKGYGFDQPVAGNSPKSATNRRVEVVKLN